MNKTILLPPLLVMLLGILGLVIITNTKPISIKSIFESICKHPNAYKEYVGRGENQFLCCNIVMPHKFEIGGCMKKEDY